MVLPSGDKLKDTYGYFKSKRFIKLAISVLAVFFTGAICGQWLFSATVTKERIKESPTVITEAVHKEQTVVAYLPKAVDNQTAGRQEMEKTDVEVNNNLPAVNVKYNGKVYNLDLLQGEEHKFDKGKLVVDQTSSLHIDFSADVEHQIVSGIRQAFTGQQQQPRIKFGIEAEGKAGKLTPVFNLRVSRQAELFDVDLRVNKDKELKLGITRWF